MKYITLILGVFMFGYGKSHSDKKSSIEKMLPPLSAGKIYRLRYVKYFAFMVESGISKSLRVVSE